VHAIRTGGDLRLQWQLFEPRLPRPMGMHRR